MAGVTLSKSQLTREKANLATYKRYLPALDLKRQQLMAARNQARAELAAVEAALATAIAEAGAALPMLADRRIDLDGLVRCGAVTFATRNVAGVKLPVVDQVEIRVAPYGGMTRPHWVDAVVTRLEAALRLKLETEVAVERVALLDRAVTRITQRTNLFEKILIPQTERNIRRILVFIGDSERAAVVAAKIAKGKGARHAMIETRT
ncbi:MULTISPECIES: V-type ATP synthase subunit D [unclassified Xanthobacter]|uniref:V-type ATP synthase subunit D n=1 Tax=unclassified Xanthobacter TaxID=2623496 RepID=UPI001EE0B67A|nr:MULTISPECIES: V-type ATP synthase subunit D [unclassified Xanthobacter]